jgi:hypothetical protein
MSDQTPWTKASASVPSGSCVELRRNAGVVEVRDSKDQHGPVLRLRRDELARWLDGARRGEFDHLLG